MAHDDPVHSHRKHAPTRVACWALTISDTKTEDDDRSGKAIQEALGLTYKAIEPTLKRQRRRPLCEAVANFDELKAAFRGSRWEDVFDDAADLGAVPATAMRQ